MEKNPIAGKTLRWTYEDGSMKGKVFEHQFGKDGHVSWRMVTEGQSKEPEKKPETTKYEVAQMNDGVCAVSYLAPSGWTLTSVLDFETGSVASFASNEKQLVVQHGRFEEVKRAA